MPFTLAQKYVSLGVPVAQARELASQIGAGVYNWKRLAELGMVPDLAKYTANSLQAGTFNANTAMKYSMTRAQAQLTKDNSSGGGSVLPAAKSTWHPEGVYASWEKNGRVFINGVEYVSQAAAVASGAATALATEGMRIAAPGGVTIADLTVRASGVTGPLAVPSAIEMFFAAGDSTANNQIYLGRHTSGGVFRSSVTTSGSSVAAMDPSGAVGAGVTFNSAAKYEANNYAVARNGGSIVTDTVGALPAITEFTFGNRYDAIRPSNCASLRVDLWINRNILPAETALLSGLDIAKGLGFSQWQKPMAIDEGGLTTFTGISWITSGRQYAVEYNSSTGAMEDFFALEDGGLDDHSHGAVENWDGHRVVMYSRHGEDGIVRWRMSNGNRVGGLATMVDAATSAGLSVVDATYNFILRNGADTYLVFQGGDNRMWDIVKTTNGQTFTQKKQLFEGDGVQGGLNQWYLLPTAVNGSGEVTFYVQQHPSNSQNVIQRFLLNLNTGDVSVSGVVKGNINGSSPGAPILTNLTAEAVRTPASGHSQRLCDARGNILITDWVTADYSGSMNKKGIYSGSWTFYDIASPGASIDPVNNPTYFPLAVELVDGSVIAPRKDGADWKLEKWTSPDNVTWTPTLIKNNLTIKTARPFVPRGGSKVYVMEAADYTDFINWQANTVGYAIP